MTNPRVDDSLAVALSDARYALRVMADLRLPIRDWTAVEAALESMLEALGSGDAEGFEAALEELSVVMPPRDTKMIELLETLPADPSRVPQPEDVLEISTRLVHAIDAPKLPPPTEPTESPGTE